ncbi:hypothetical protein CVT25_006137 [Psilocybe cyanescens]|uniref:Uncharacterized protein n=1 Tax=Psilocybe cyanescens TaxID=93625 RepID=A0A409WYX6_PSICY|nr:hypothetical protein CVT25_006137 [Psilocybe cyanescens]
MTPPTRLIQISQKRADGRAPHMPNIERLGDVRRRVLDGDLTLARVVRAVLRLATGCVAREGIDLGEHLANLIPRVYGEVEEGLVEHDRLDPIFRLELCGVNSCKPLFQHERQRIRELLHDSYPERVQDTFAGIAGNGGTDEAILLLLVCSKSLCKSAAERSLVLDALFFASLAPVSVPTTSIGKVVPLDERENGNTARNEVFNLIYKRTEGLVVHRGLGYRADCLDRMNAERFPIIVLGFPDLPPTEKQKKIVTQMMGLKEEDLLKVYLDM